MTFPTQTLMYQKLKHAWYNNLATQYEIIKQLKNKELCLLTPKYANQQRINTRTWRCHNTQHWQTLHEGLSITKKGYPYNYYKSVATYQQGIPYQTMNLSQRNNDAWIHNHHQEIIEYPFIIDIDSPTHEDLSFAKEATRTLTKQMHKQKQTFTVTFSGCGFHITTPSPAPPNFDPSQNENVYQWHQDLAQDLKETITELIDTSIYDSRRVIKIPYTLSQYEDATYICWPLTPEELTAFKLEDYELETFTQTQKYLNIKNRGIPPWHQQQKESPAHKDNTN